MAGLDFAFFQLLYKMLSHQTGSISRVDFHPQKPRFEGREIPMQFPRTSPEAQGISSDHIREYLQTLAGSQASSPHHSMIMRHGNVISECSFFPYERGIWHITHSLCKSVTGMAVGFAVDEGILSLDEKILDIFSRHAGVFSHIRRGGLTVEDLLNMTSGVDFSEAGAISGNTWRAGYMNAPQKFEAGSQFEYNSMNSYMLSAAIQEKTGLTMMEYLRPRLFEPLGIDEIFWERCPQGVTKGGWGMFIKPEDALKLGYLYLHGGSWKGRQIIPRSWVEASTAKHSDGGAFGYGYQLWMDERPGSFAFNRLFGQDVVVDPDIDMVYMVNAGSRELFQTGELTSIMRYYWGGHYRPSDTPLPEDPEAYARLIQLERNLMDGIWKPAQEKHEGFWIYPAQSHSFRTEDLIRQLSGRSYRMEQGTIGLFPLICQVMHNNFTEGISRIGFEEDDGTLAVLFREGESTQKIRISFGGEKYISQIDLRGEPYLVSMTGRITTDEMDRIALVLELYYMEESCSRVFHMFFSGKDLELRATEKPGDKVIMEALDYTGGGSLMENRIIRRIIPQGTENIMDESLYFTVHPTDIGHVEEGGSQMLLEEK